jgi:hypothetical protein
MPMKKNKNHLFWNARGRLKVWKSIFLCFQVENKVISMYKIFFLHLILFSIGSITLLLEGVTSLIVNPIENGRGIKL